MEIDQAELAVEHYTRALEVCKCVNQDVDPLQRQVLTSLANYWQGPLNNTLKAEEYRRALVQASNKPYCYGSCLENKKLQK